MTNEISSNNYLLEQHRIVLIALEHYNPLGIIRSFGELGIKIDFVGVEYKVPVASASMYVGTHHRVNSIQEAYETVLREYGDVYQETGNKPILLFSDDDVYSVFDENIEELQKYFITANAGINRRVIEFMDKYVVQECARRHGLPVIESHVVKPGVVPEGLVYPVITKAISPLAGAWKGDFHICENEKELRESMATINAEKCMIQPFIEKKTEVQYEGFSYNHGKGMFTGIQIANNYPIKGYYGPYMNIFPPKHENYISKLNAMLEEIGFEGLWEIEFLVDKDDNYWFLEINFRSSPWHRAATIAGMPLAYYWILTMLTGQCPKPNTFEPFDAMVETVDYGKRVDGGCCTLAEWLSDFKNAKCTYYYDSIDQEPWNLVVKNWDKLK